MKRFNLAVLGIAVLALALALACNDNDDPLKHPQVNREDKLPQDIAKVLPEDDHHPPILHSDEFEEPVPLPWPVNTSGGEDSAFMLPDGNTLYVWFTPDVRVPPEQQILDEVTGVYVTHRTEDGWTAPERVWLQQPGKLVLDGCVAIQGDEMWFCSAREGYEGVNMFTAELVDGEWVNWQYVGDQLMVEYEIGEVHIHGDDLYFHSWRDGGKGGLDIWVTTRSYHNGEITWSEPVNMEVFNTPGDEGFPFISTDGQEFWFTRTYMGTPAIFRSIKVDGQWTEPELIVSQFAGEPTLDDAGNLYFTHHFFKDGEMIEADIYVAYRKSPRN